MSPSKVSITLPVPHRTRRTPPAFLDGIAAGDDERRDLCLRTARRLGTTVQNIEKDFWVCWTLDTLFNGLPEDGPRLLFKGGTSLSSVAKNSKSTTLSQRAARGLAR